MHTQMPCNRCVIPMKHCMQYHTKPNSPPHHQDRGSTESTPLPTELLRVYIEYARAYCKPTLTDEAKAVLQAFYVQLRTAAVGTEGIPITVGMGGLGNPNHVCRRTWSHKHAHKQC